MMGLFDSLDMTLTWDFLGVKEIPAGKALIISYKRTLGFDRGSVYEARITSQKELELKIEHIGEFEDTLDALITSKGLKYQVLEMSWKDI